SPAPRKKGPRGGAGPGTAPERSRLLAAVDEVVAALQIAVAHGAVHVDGRLLEALVEIEVQRAVVDRVADLHGEPIPDERQHVAQRIHRPVHPVADAVAHGERWQERQDQVWPRSQSPLAERLAEIDLGLLQPELLLGDVPEPAEPERAVDEE